MKEKSKFLESHKENWEQLQEAFKNGQVCMLEATFKNTDEKVPVICAINIHEEEYELVPFAMMMTVDPYELLEPPEYEDPTKIILDKEQE